MQTSRHLGLGSVILIVYLGTIGLAAPVDEKQTTVKESTNSAVPVDEEQTEGNATSLTAPASTAKTAAIKKIEEAPKGQVSSTAQKETKDPVNRLFYTGHRILWWLERLWERVKYTFKRTIGFRMQRFYYPHYYNQYPAYPPGYGR